MYYELAKEFAYKFCEDALDFTKDMMLDQPNEYSTYKDAKACIVNSLESFSEACLDDYLDDFCKTVREEIAKRKVTVNSISFDDTGFRSALQTVEVKN